VAERARRCRQWSAMRPRDPDIDYVNAALRLVPQLRAQDGLMGKRDMTASLHRSCRQAAKGCGARAPSGSPGAWR
jgi:hypothetical protein